MPTTTIQKRTQFSSCDSCRRLRVACDASRHGHRPGKMSWHGSCSRCARRKQLCTFEWINNARTKLAEPCREPCLNPCTSELEPTDAYETYSPNASADVVVTTLSHQLFELGFETIFGRAIGRNGCPLVDDSDSDLSIPAMKIFGKLDTYLDEELARQDSSAQYDVSIRKQVKEHQITQSLDRAIQAFVARWLPLIPGKYHATPGKDEELIRESWRAARQDMLKIINHPSYRSVLALYLFAQTPIPIGISEDEESDGISPSLCLQTALLQVQRLRGGQKSQRSRNSELLAQAGPPLSSAPIQGLRNAYLDLETRAYWAAVMWDTSNSLTSSFRASLTSGLKGGCSEPAWRLARSFLLGSFSTKTAPWRTNGFEVTDDAASEILCAANISILYIWKNIASLREALREGVEEDGVLFAWKALLDAIDIYRTLVGPLMDRCERQLHFLEQTSQRSWYEVSLRFHLGILVSIDALERAGRSVLLAQMSEARTESEHESFNVLKFGIENAYTIPQLGDREDANSAPTSSQNARGREQSVSLSFIAIDPFPHHVIDTAILMKKAIDRQLRQGNIKHGVHCYLSSMLMRALKQLPQSSRSVRAILEDLQRSFDKEDGTAATTEGF